MPYSIDYNQVTDPLSNREEEISQKSEMAGSLGSILKFITPENMLGMQILGPYLRPSESETLHMNPNDL